MLSLGRPAVVVGEREREERERPVPENATITQHGYASATNSLLENTVINNMYKDA